VIDLEEVEQFEIRNVVQDSDAANISLLQHHLDLAWPVDVLEYIKKTFVHVLRYEVYPQTQTPEPIFDLGEDVGREHHDHEGIRVINDEATFGESLSVLNLKNFD
jgi:hypothetical protein